MASIAKFDEWQYTNGNKVNTVIQVVNTFVTERSTWGYTGSGGIVTALNAVITPKFSTSKILVHWMISGETNPHDTVLRVYKNGSAAPNGTNPNDSNYWAGFAPWGYDSDVSSTPRTLCLNYVDASVGSTAATTYQISFFNANNGSGTFYLNRPVNSAGTTSYEVGTSSAIIMEIAQ
jgi:hypothetical protein